MNQADRKALKHQSYSIPLLLFIGIRFNAASSSAEFYEQNSLLKDVRKNTFARNKRHSEHSRGRRKNETTGSSNTERSIWHCSTADGF